MTVDKSKAEATGVIWRCTVCRRLSQAPEPCCGREVAALVLVQQYNDDDILMTQANAARSVDR